MAGETGMKLSDKLAAYIVELIMHLPEILEDK